MKDSKESSRSHWGCHSSQAQCVSVGRGSSRHASRLRVTRHEERYRIMCERSPAGGQKRDGRSGAGSHQCKSRHHEGSMPKETKLSVTYVFNAIGPTEIPYPHCRMKRTCNLVVLFQSRAATKNFWQPELSNGALHVSNSALNRSRGAHPL
jgi:hypothetical protein